jgi:hypothetical protein
MISSLLTLTFGWLSRLTLKQWPPKAKTLSLSLIFDGSCFGAPSKRTSCGDREPATGRLLWTHGESQCQDLGAPLPYPWRERGKPLEGRVAAAHLDVVSCGLWVVGCGLWVVGCGLCCWLVSAVSSIPILFQKKETILSLVRRVLYFYQCKLCPHPTDHSNDTPTKVSTAETSSYTEDVSAVMNRG